MKFGDQGPWPGARHSCVRRPCGKGTHRSRVMPVGERQSGWHAVAVVTFCHGMPQWPAMSGDVLSERGGPDGSRGFEYDSGAASATGQFEGGVKGGHVHLSERGVVTTPAQSLLGRHDTPRVRGVKGAFLHSAGKGENDPHSSRSLPAQARLLTDYRGRDSGRMASDSTWRPRAALRAAGSGTRGPARGRRGPARSRRRVLPSAALSQRRRR